MTYAVFANKGHATSHLTKLDKELGYPVKCKVAGKRGKAWPDGKFPEVKSWAEAQQHPTEQKWAIPLPPESAISPSKREELLSPPNATLLSALTADWKPTP